MKSPYLSIFKRRVDSGSAFIFHDLFTEASNTELSLHTPDIGTSWTQLIEVGTCTLSVIATTNSVRGTIDRNIGTLYTADVSGGYGSDDMVIEVDITEEETSDKIYWLAVRAVDSDNLYALVFNNLVFQIAKKVSGSWSYLTDAGAELTCCQTVALQISGSSIKGYIDKELIVSDTDTSIASGGEAGIGMGNIDASSSDIETQEFLQVKVFNTGIYPRNADKFCDNFSGTLELSNGSHTPLIGTGWTRVLQVSSSTISALNSITLASVFGSDGSLYTAEISGGLASADYSVHVVIRNLAAGDNYSYIILRYQDNNNYYAVEIGSPGQLYKNVAGSWSTLGSSFTTDDDDIIEVICEGTNISVIRNGIEVVSVTDSAHSSAGKAAYGVGALRDSGADSGGQAISSFRVSELE